MKFSTNPSSTELPLEHFWPLPVVIYLLRLYIFQCVVVVAMLPVFLLRIELPGSAIRFWILMVVIAFLEYWLLTLFFRNCISRLFSLLRIARETIRSRLDEVAKQTDEAKRSSDLQRLHETFDDLDRLEGKLEDALENGIFGRPKIVKLIVLSRVTKLQGMTLFPGIS